MIEHDAGVLLLLGILAIRDRRRRGSDVSAAPARMLAPVSSKRGEYMFALYSGSLADPGDRNPYADSGSLVLPKLWSRGYERAMRVRIETGPAMQAYRGAGTGRGPAV